MGLHTYQVLFSSIMSSSSRRVILRHLLRFANSAYKDRTHLEYSIEWLCRAQDNSGCSGCSASFSIIVGWAPPYPETTGYIISTFLKYSTLVKNNSYKERAMLMGDWEIEIQLPNGAVRGGSGINEYPIVFNTGMVILGWTDLYQNTGELKYLTASVKAADWLCSIQDDDGKWSKDTYNGIAHAYHSRVAWSLLELYKLTNDSKYMDSARRNVEWVLSDLQSNGWIAGMGFYSGDISPLTHTIAYTLRGLLESSIFFDNDLRSRSQLAVFNAAHKLLAVYDSIRKSSRSKIKLLPGRFNAYWQPSATFSCLTGNAQIAIIWMKIYMITGEQQFLSAAVEIIEQLKKVQDISNSNMGIRGGIPGSLPIWGEYMQLSYPNWAVKFFADALMLKEFLTEGQSDEELTVLY